MERRKLENIFTYFQAHARGYLVRKEVRRAREDFEDIVREIDGGLTHLLWRNTVIPTPHFTDTDGPLPRPSSEASASLLLQSRGDDQTLLTQKIEAERDKSQIKGHGRLSSNNDGGVDGRGQRDKEGEKEREAPESVGGSTTIWSSLELDVNHSFSHQGPRQYCSAQEVPRTPEALRLHRNTLTMELVWLQQAIDSRKKYLSLKGRLAIP